MGWSDLDFEEFNVKDTQLYMHLNETRTFTDDLIVTRCCQMLHVESSVFLEELSIR